MFYILFAEWPARGAVGAAKGRRLLISQHWPRCC
jgi:hypothetical protein